MVRVSLYHDTRKVKKNGKYPVKLRVYFYKRLKYYPTDVDLSKEEFQKLNYKRTTQDIMGIKNDLEALLVHARELSKQIKPFNFSIFEKKLQQKPALGVVFRDSCQRYIDKLLREGRIGNAVSHRTAMVSILQFKSKV